MKAVISVVGKDQVGILSKVATKCSEFNANIEDVSQTILQDMFTMIMIIDFTLPKDNFLEFVDNFKKYGEENNLVIHVMHQDIFNAMHTI